MLKGEKLNHKRQAASRGSPGRAGMWTGEVCGMRPPAWDGTHVGQLFNKPVYARPALN